MMTYVNRKERLSAIFLPIVEKFGSSDPGLMVEELIKGVTLDSPSLSFKDKLIAQSNGKPVCWLCSYPIYLDEPLNSDAAFSIDHADVKKADGGETSLDNCRPAHRLCNSIRHYTNFHPRVRKRLERMKKYLASRKKEKQC